MSEHLELVDEVVSMQ